MAHCASLTCNKTRLYIGLYVRGGQPKMVGQEDTYHWALLTGPKRDPKSGPQHTMYHVKARLAVDDETNTARPEWEYHVESDRASMLLVRIVVAKVCDLSRLEDILRHVPVRSDKPEWNCVAWVREALHLATLDRHALGSRVADWDAIRDQTMWYVEWKKTNHRFDGLGEYDISKPATYDMVDNVELIV
ncbi:hypothetical protein E4U59_000298 [Claviceps monticola]|nr:hypothetical protein E4U59_000298 [Claviceps monticola]